MISIETEARMIKFILTIGKEDSAIEQLRQNLAQLSYFEPYSAFQRIDKSLSGFITVEDLEIFLLYYLNFM